MASIQSKTSKAGDTTYYVVAAKAGRRKWLRAGSLQNARHLLKQVENLVDLDKVEKLGLNPKDTRIDDFLAGYLDQVRLRTAPATLKRYRYALNSFLMFLTMFRPGIKRLSQLSPAVIEQYMQKRLESEELKKATDGESPWSRKEKVLPKPQTVNYEVKALRSALIWARDRGLSSSVPTNSIKYLRPVPKRKIRLLDEGECKRLLKTADKMASRDAAWQVFAQAFRLMLNTGLRSGELCNLTWDDVDLKTGLLKIQEKPGWAPKTQPREFFMNSVCMALLKQMAKRKGLIFTKPSGSPLSNDDLRKALIIIAKTAGIEGLTRCHDLRHTFNSLMQMNGVDPATMGRILGHKDIETTMIYTHQTDEHLKKSIGKIGL